MTSPGERPTGFTLLTRLEKPGLVATGKFLVVLSVLLILPDRNVTSLYGLNPRTVWLVVVFVAGVSYFGYILTKLLGPEKGIGLTGFLGGCVASTPTVVAMAEKARRNPDMEKLYIFGASLAGVAMIGKMFFIVAAVSMSVASAIIIPFLAMAIVSLLITTVVWTQFRATKPTAIELDNQFKLKQAFAFGVFVALVLILVENTDIVMPSVYAETGGVLAVSVNFLFKMGISSAGGTNRMTQVFLVLFLATSLTGVGFVLLS